MGTRLAFVECISVHFANDKIKSTKSAVPPERQSWRSQQARTATMVAPSSIMQVHASQDTSMEVRMYVVNAFTAPESSSLRTGNPAAVALLTEAQNARLSDDARQELAAEMNLSETAFIARIPDGNAAENRFMIRWFTPAVEVDLCGHATLAAARSVIDEGLVTSGDILFETKKKGTLRVQADEQELRMEFPSLEKREELDEQEKQMLRGGLGVEVVESFRSDYDMVARVADKDTVVGLEVSHERLRDLDTRGVIVTAGCGGEDGVRFVSRFFAPKVGIEEDPVTGSAHCVLAGMYLENGETNIEARQMSERGGWLKIGRQQDGMVSIAGRTRVVWKGTVFL